MNQTNTIACPSCGAQIVYDVYGLLGGKKFICPGCSLAVSLAAESRETVQDAMNKYEKLKESSRNGGTENETL
ncbi:hypothetical protein [uncultured Treponema sp.]|uniref:hypothetical protein n=1 Tax=uncultured Treponema sp. TaxID=162155 RepID=UPI002591C1C8|nr:hypothetical protein [uncultured Treponema sp.]